MFLLGEECCGTCCVDMLYLVNKLTQILMVVLVLLIIAAVGIFVYVFITRNRRSKRTINDEDTIEVAFNKKDTREYVKNIEDIHNDMIVTDGGRRFIAGLKCTGFDYFFEQAERQLATVSGMYAFTNTITKPVSYRQYSKPVDLEYMLNRYQKAMDERNEDLFHVQEDLKDMEANLSRDREHLSLDDIQLYEREIASAKKKREALQFRCYHLADQIRKIRMYSGRAVDPDSVEIWFYEWAYDPYDFSYDMKQDEIYYRAVKELYSIGETKIHALANCGVRARRCTTDELIDACRWYSSPISSERYKLSDIKKSTFFDDIKTSDPYKQACERAEDEIREKANVAYLNAVKEANEKVQAEAAKDIPAQQKTEKKNRNAATDKLVADQKKEKPAAGHRASVQRQPRPNPAVGRRPIVRSSRVKESREGAVSHEVASKSVDLISED